jgi:hypothetical protein
LVDWSFAEDHVWRRHGVPVQWLTEALSDLEALVLTPDPASRSGQSVRTIGLSVSSGCLITVITVEVDGVTYGVNGWQSSKIDIHRYEEEEQ